MTLDSHTTKSEMHGLQGRMAHSEGSVRQQSGDVVHNFLGKKGRE